MCLKANKENVIEMWKEKRAVSRWVCVRKCLNNPRGNMCLADSKEPPLCQEKPND